MNVNSGSSSASPAPSPSVFFSSIASSHYGGMMHMTFFYGKNTEVLLDGWPGTSMPMHWVFLAAISLFSIARMDFAVRVMKAGPASFGGGIVHTLVYTVRTGLSYLIMLTVISLNGGVILAAMAGFGLGFIVGMDYIHPQKPIK